MDFGQSVVWEKDKDEETDADLDPRAVHHAAAAGQMDKLIRAIQVDPSILEQQDAGGLTPLGHAIIGRQLAAVKKLVKMGSNVNAQDSLGRTGLAIAAYQGWYEGVVYLLRHGARLHLCDKSGRSPLHASTYDSDYRTMEFGTIELYTGDQAGQNGIALYPSPWQTVVWTMCALLHNLSKSEINHKDHEGMTALHWCAFHNRPDHVRILLERGADLFREDIDGKTALHWAAQNGNLQCCELLYKWKGGRSLLNHGDYAGKTPVHYAAAAGNISVIQSFASVDDCDLEAEDTDDRTPLHWAVATGQAECVALLLDLGVTPNAVDAEGCIPLDYAKQSNHQECRKILEEKIGLNTNSSSVNSALPGNTAEHFSGQNNNSAPFRFIKGLFGIGHRKNLSQSDGLAEISSSDMRSVDMDLLKQEMADSSEVPECDKVSDGRDVPTNSTEGQTANSSEPQPQDQESANRNSSYKLTAVDRTIDENSSDKSTANLQRVDDRVLEVDNSKKLPLATLKGHPTGVKDMPDQDFRVREIKLKAEVKEEKNTSSIVNPVQVYGKNAINLEPMTSFNVGDIPLSPSHRGAEPQSLPSTPGRVQIRAVTSPSELAPLKGPKPPKGINIHEKVLALRIEKSGPSRSPTPPSWIDRPFDPLSFRQQPERSPLASGDLSSQFFRDAQGRAGSKLTAENRLPSPVNFYNTVDNSSRTSPDFGSNTTQLSPPSLKTVINSKYQSVTRASKPTTGTFSSEQRKQLDKQLHNLLL